MEVKTGVAKPNPKAEKIRLKATDGHPYLKEGEVFEVHPNHKTKLIDSGWAVEIDAKSTKADNPKTPKKASDKKNAAASTDAEGDKNPV